MDKNLYVQISGSGAPVVFLHGYLSSSIYFRPMRRRLNKTNQVITVDLLGFGSSPKPKKAITHDEQVEAIRRALKTCGIKAPFTLIGHSMGALIAIRYAHKHPDDIQSLQLFNPPMFSHKEEATRSIKATGVHYRLLFHSPWRRTFWRVLKALPRMPATARFALNLTDILRASYQAREGSYTNIVATNFFADIQTISQPALLVVGSRDRRTYRENLLVHRPLPSNIDVKLVNTGHHTLVTTPNLAEKLIRTHLNSH